MASLFPQLKKGTELAKVVVSDFCKFSIKMCQELYRVREGLGDKQRVRLAVQSFLTIAGFSFFFFTLLLHLLLFHILILFSFFFF